MLVDFILCDHAEAVQGKLYINGGGWAALYAANRPATMYLALVITIDWNETNTPYDLVAELLTADGDVVHNGEPPQPIRAGARLEIGRPPGVKPGTSLPACMAIGVANIVLEAGQYVWQVTAGGEEVARKAFQVLVAPQLPGYPAVA